MNGINLGILQSELALFGLALAVFFADLFSDDAKPKRFLGYLSALGLLVILAWSILSPAPDDAKSFGGMFLSDGPARVFKVIFTAAALLTVLGSIDYLEDAKVRWQGEFYFLVLMVTIGMNLIASAGNLLSLYVALEINTIGFYVLVSLLKGGSPTSTETGLKYLILGALSSATLLYGISLIYGMSGTLSLVEAKAFIQGAQASPLLLTAVALVLVGFAFKITLVPFHAWSPDVYQGAPTPVTAFLSVGSKAAGFAAITRVFLVTFSSLTPLWSQLLIVLAVVTFVLSNVVALKQSNIKRLLAYSSIGQAGYLVIAVLSENAPQPAGTAPSHLGLYSLVYYLMVYVFTNMAAFTVAMRVSADSGNDDIASFKGLAQRSPALAMVMMMSMFSLAGIPPFGGFFGKFYIFMAGMEAHYALLVGFAVFMSIISLYYYLVVVKRMYLENPDKAAPVPSSLSVRLSLGTCAAFMIGMGVCPQAFLDWIKTALGHLG
jgi:NADH-quinone oxidoreductase subunit N